MEELVKILPIKNEDSKPGVYIKTFGCQMNEYDSQKLGKILEDRYCLVDVPEKAELILVNTCSVREKPEHKLYTILGQVREIKKRNPKVMVGVGGCVAQQEGENILKYGSKVDFVFGTHNLSLVPSLIDLRKNGAPPQVAVDYRDEWEDLPLGYTGEEKVSALVSISRGCNKNCAYCIVPTTRGVEVSRDPKEIEKEVRIAVHRGSKEIVLLGQTVNSYGLDFSPRMSFVELLKRIADIQGVERIRFTSPHPQEVKKDFIDLVCSEPKVCPHIHMPLQSGSDRILKLMNRNYRRKRYLSIIEELRSRVPDMGITTDIIVGFPGETEEDFQETMEILEIVRFQNSYSYMFSPRPGTKAEEMGDTVPEEVKLRRLQTYQARQEVLTQEYLDTWIGKEVPLLIDGPSSSNKSILQGRTPHNIVTNLIKEYAELKAGQTHMTKIVGRGRFTLKGEVVSDTKA